MAGQASLTSHLNALNVTGATRRMQAAIAANAHRFMYSVKGVYQEDAVYTLLTAMARALDDPVECPRVFGVEQLELSHLGSLISP